ncbi:MAG: 3-mercaptopyruvate sulfurtransferase [Parvibaculum sp.]
MPQSVPHLVSTDWLADHLGAPDIKIVDGSWHMPAAARDPRAEFEEAHIPGAVFFDLDEISDTDSPYPHMLPSTEKFCSRMKSMGIGDGHHIIAYDSSGLFSAARLWWTFRVHGHERVSVLNGGLKKWKAEGRPLAHGISEASERHYTARINNFIIRDKAAIRSNIESKREQVIDARSKGRFDGTAPEPRAGLASGHIPGSLSLPFDLLISEEGTLKDETDLRAHFEAAGVDLARPIITTCGSGVTAAILYLALTSIGHQNVALYDGSWTEWAADPTSPIKTSGS